MSYTALYRKWRPSVFEDVVEQEHVVKTLRNSINTQRIAHAYLFCGTRGTGKTTMAKIFSRAINCLNPKNGDPCNECEICTGILSDNILDVIEIDAASNNSVDNVREIRDEVIYAPSQAKYKVYIIDEVHMLSSGAFNALLKTLEEPPSHVVFILATTDPHKLPATILSRCQRFDFRRITLESIMGRIKSIADANGVTLKDEAARLIARMADGALRDAISILDQCISMGNAEITYEDVLIVVGIVNDDFIAEMAETLNNRDINGILEKVEQLVMDGKDIVKFVSDIVLYYRNLLLCKVTANPSDIIEASREGLERMKSQASELEQERIIYIIKELSAMEPGLKWSAHPRILLEVGLIKLCKNNSEAIPGDLAQRLASIESRISSGSLVQKPEDKSGAAKAPAEKESKAAGNAAPGEQKSPGKKVNYGKAFDGWEGIINQLKSSGRMAMYTNLIGTSAVEIDESFVGIVFENGCGFNKMFVSKMENLEVLEGMVSSRLGRTVRIKCLDEDELGKNQKAGNPEEKDEFVEKAKSIAERLGAPVNFIDE